MWSSAARFMGGYALSRRDLRLLYAATFLSFLGASIAFPLRLLYAQQHGATPVQLGLMAASFTLAPLLVQVPIGWLVDHWGRVPVITVAMLVHPVLAFLYIPLHSPAELIALRFLEGISVAAFAPAIGAYVADVTPEEHLGEAYGALQAIFSVGLLIGPLFGGVIGQYFGFSTAFLVNVAIELLALPLVLGPVHEPAVHRNRQQEERSGWRDLLTLPLLAVYLLYFAAQVAMGSLGSLWSIWINDIGGSYTYIGITFAVFALPQIFLGTGAGRIADRVGRAKLLVISGIVAGIVYASYGSVTNLVLIMALGVVEGIAIVFEQPIAQALLAASAPADARGRAQGLAGAIGAGGGSLAAFASLPLYHRAHPLPFVLAGIIFILGTSSAALVATLFRARRPEVAAAQRSA